MFVLSQCYGQLFAVLEQHYNIYENNVKSAISRYVECEFVDQYLIYYTTPAYDVVYPRTWIHCKKHISVLDLKKEIDVDIF